VPLLFQTGYLTIDRESTADNGEKRYSFKIPNLEITNSFREILLQNVLGFSSDKKDELAGRVKRAITKKDAKELELNHQSPAYSSGKILPFRFPDLPLLFGN
jgi:hypothetical protein